MRPSANRWCRDEAVRLFLSVLPGILRGCRLDIGQGSAGPRALRGVRRLPGILGRTRVAGVPPRAVVGAQISRGADAAAARPLRSEWSRDSIRLRRRICQMEPPRKAAENA